MALKTEFSETIQEIGHFIYSTEEKDMNVYGDIIVDGGDHAIIIDGLVCTGCRRDFKGTQTKVTTKILGIGVYSRYKDFKPA